MLHRPVNTIGKGNKSHNSSNHYHHHCILCHGSRSKLCQKNLVFWLSWFVWEWVSVHVAWICSFLAGYQQSEWVCKCGFWFEGLTTRLSFSTAPFLTGFHLLLFLDSICWYVSLCYCVHVNLSELLFLFTMHLHRYLIRDTVKVRSQVKVRSYQTNVGCQCQWWMLVDAWWMMMMMTIGCDVHGDVGWMWCSCQVPVNANVNVNGGCQWFMLSPGGCQWGCQYVNVGWTPMLGGRQCWAEANVHVECSWSNECSCRMLDVHVKSPVDANKPKTVI